MIFNEVFLMTFTLMIFVCFLIFTTLKIRKKRISPRRFFLFLIPVILLAICRLGLYVYLKIFLPHYEYTLLENILSVFLYPEVPISYVLIPSLMPEAIMDPTTPIHYRPMFWIILSILFIYGSFLWLFPTLILISEKKPKDLSEK